ncbi:NADPH:quinone oxidoreductase family protein [Amycolatopsis jejuensis]|uniref:NADPH:quinone oxidoreductase family protein n=1 Tax=Amycolatopsis jejuensis TaxID=330084 RepID=UPI000525E025|nr:NADPH:quinone oxidoreductase family protein [Amycolatopsis jejuensis]
MRAWQVSELGEPDEVVHVAEVAVPDPGRGEVVVQVLGGAANFPDVLACRGEYQVKTPLPFTPGLEACGSVVACGDGVRGFAIGDRVLGMTVPPHGGFAEFATLNASATFPAPPALDDREAAALLVAYQTSWFGLHRRANLKAGETLLVHAAAGGVGSAAVQLGKAAGATVIGVVGGPEKVAVARDLGADVVVDRHQEDFVTVVRDRTGGRGADVIYDPVGGDTYHRSTKAIAFEGRLVVVGFAEGRIPTAKLNHPLLKNYSIVGLRYGLYHGHDPAAVGRCHAELTELARDGAVRPLVERMTFGEVPAGLRRLADGETTGRLVWAP